MRYQQPFGVSDPDSPYINGDPSIARMGSIPPAAAFEQPMRELVAVIADSSLVPTDDDLEQVAKGVRSQRMNYVEDTGSINTLSVALDPPLQIYTIGIPLRVKIRGTNTGPSTIDAGAGRVPIRKPTGAEVAAGDLPAGGLAELVYDGTVFQMINFGGAGGGTGDVFLTNIPYCVDTSTVVNTVIANFAPAITTYSAGLIFMVKIANTNNSFSNINVNGLGLKPIYAQGGHPNWPLLPGDIQVGDVLVFVYDGSTFWIYANQTITQNVTFNVSNPTQVNQLFAALGRKRISTSGFVTVQLAAGIYGPPAPSAAVITTYHADAGRINIIGTMKAGQVPPPNGNYFQRSGYSPAQRANDAAANIVMLRARYATEIRLGSSPSIGIQHVGPGQITYQNLLITGPNVSVIGQGGIAAGSNASIYCVNCSVWGSGDVGYDCVDGASITTVICHASSCVSRGYACGNGASMGLLGGGSYGNGDAGVEAAYGGSVVTNATDAATLALGFQCNCNPNAGMRAQSGSILAQLSLVTINSVDMYAVNMGTVAQFLANVGSMSPAAGEEGNLNSISVFYG